MPKSKRTTKLRTQRNPVSLYDPDGSLAYDIDRLAALLEHKIGVPINRPAAVKKAVDNLAEARMIDDRISDSGIDIDKLVQDWRVRHKLAYPPV